MSILENRFFHCFLISLIIKISYLFFFNIYFSNITHDSWEYIQLGKSIALNLKYEIDGVSQMNRGPGYPLFLSIFFIFSEKLHFVVIAQIILDSLCVCLVVSIWEKVHNSIISKTNILIFASCIYLNHYNQLIMTETLYSFLIVLGIWFLTKDLNKNSEFKDIGLKNYILSSVILGFVVLIRQPIIFSICLFGLLIFLIFIIKGKINFFNEFLKLTTSLFVIILILGVWSIRNYFNFKDEILSNPNATIIGYKTNIKNYNHFYNDEFKEYVHSYEEPFIMVRPYQKPIFAKYVYQNEYEDVKVAFEKLEDEVINNKQRFVSQETLDLFQSIAKKRYDEKPLLHITAPISRILKLIFSPRIGALTQSENSVNSLNSSKFLFYTLLIYNFLFILFFSIGLMRNCTILKPKLNIIVFCYVLSFLVSHLTFYSFYSPFVQSRYFIPLLPLLFIYIPNLSIKLFPKFIK